MEKKNRNLRFWNEERKNGNENGRESETAWSNVFTFVTRKSQHWNIGKLRQRRDRATFATSTHRQRSRLLNVFCFATPSSRACLLPISPLAFYLLFENVNESDDVICWLFVNWRSKILLGVIDSRWLGRARVVKVVNLFQTLTPIWKQDDAAACSHDNGTAGKARGKRANRFVDVKSSSLVFRAKNR